jgi:hypothetical protein
VFGLGDLEQGDRLGIHPGAGDSSLGAAARTAPGAAARTAPGAAARTAPGASACNHGERL